MAAKKGEADWNAMWEVADRDGNGFLTIQELAAMLRQHDSKMSDRECCDIFISLDGASTPTEILALMNNPDKKVTKDKFISGMIRLQGFVTQAEEVFSTYDKDGSGFLEKNEVIALIKTAFKKSDAEAKAYADDIMDHEDLNKDGKISKEELIAALS